MNIKDLIVQKIPAHIDHRGYLIEGWRSDSTNFKPEMMYVSYSNPKVRRGAHLHLYQEDYFVFLGPANFRVVVIDNRPDSSTYNDVDDFCVGVNNPAYVVVPTNCWHGYQNVSNETGMVINLPNKLYKGKNYQEKVDEVRCSWDKLYDWPGVQD